MAERAEEIVQAAGEAEMDKQRAIEFAQSQGYRGPGEHLTKRQIVCDAPAIDSLEFCEGIDRAIVTRVVPFSEVAALLSPLSMEMVRQARERALAHIKGNPEWSDQEWRVAMDSFNMLEKFLRQQIEQGGADRG